MNSLPVEILLRIFDDLSAPDLINLCSISRYFNEIISDSKLSHKLTIHFRKLNENSHENALRRNYRKLRIGFYKIQVHAKVLTEIGENLTQIEFCFCRLKLDLMRRILLVCMNVKILKFLKAQLSDVPNDVKLPLPALTGVELELICSDSKIFKILLGCIVTSLTMDHKYKYATGELEDLTKFLSYQNQLELIDLRDFHRTSLFTDHRLHHVRFKLKELRLNDINLAKTVHFKSFLENNCLESLEILHIKKLDNCNISQIISNLRNLKELKIDSHNYLSDVEELPNLKALTFFGFLPLKLNLILHKFPSLKTIEMHYSRLCYDEEEFMKAYGRISFPFEFERMKIIDSTVAKLKTKTIKSLELKNVKICEDFFEENQQIKNLSVENCDFRDEMFSRIFKVLSDLESLEIIDEKVTQKTIDEIKSCKNLKTLRLKHLKKNFNLKEIEENKNLKIYVKK